MRTTARNVLLMGMSLSSGLLQAQEGGSLPVCEDYCCHRGLGTQIEQGGIERLNFTDAGLGFLADSQKMATSFLRPSGNAPKRPEEPPPEEGTALDRWEERARAYESWSCRYAPARAFDRDPKTAWCEGVEGDGGGEILLAPIRRADRVEIWAGYGKSNRLFFANGRPRKIRLVILAATRADAHQYGTMLGGLKIVAQKVITLKEQNGFQAIDLPELRGKAFPFALAAVRILSVAKGKRYRDTCISEIR